MKARSVTYYSSWAASCREQYRAGVYIVFQGFEIVNFFLPSIFLNYFNIKLWYLHVKMVQACEFQQSIPTNHPWFLEYVPFYNFFLHIQNISNLARNTEVVKTAQKYVHNRQSAVSFSLHDTSKLRKVLKIPTICQALLLHIGKYSIIRQRQYALVLFRKRLAKYYHWDKLSVDFKNRLKGTCWI